MNNKYISGTICDITSYGNSTTQIIDDEEKDIIEMSYSITIHDKHTDKKIVLFSHSKNKLTVNKDTHIIYDDNNHILEIISDPKTLLKELQENQKFINNKLSFFELLKASFKGVYPFTLLTTSLLFLITFFSSKENIDLTALIVSPILYWIFFTSIICLFTSWIASIPLYSAHNIAKMKKNYYKSFIEYQNKQIVREKTHEYI